MAILHSSITHILRILATITLLLLHRVSSIIPTTTNPTNNLTSPSPSPSPIDSFPPFRTDSPQTPTHILIQPLTSSSSSSPTLPIWNVRPGLSAFTLSLRRALARAVYQHGAHTALERTYHFNNGLSEGWQWRMRVFDNGRERASWNDAWAAAVVVEAEMRRFWSPGRGYRTVEVVVGRLGDADAEGRGRLAVGWLWWGRVDAGVGEGEGEGDVAAVGEGEGEGVVDGVGGVVRYNESSDAVS